MGEEDQGELFSKKSVSDPINQAAVFQKPCSDDQIQIFATFLPPIEKFGTFKNNYSFIWFRE